MPVTSDYAHAIIDLQQNSVIVVLMVLLLKYIQRWFEYAPEIRK